MACFAPDDRSKIAIDWDRYDETEADQMAEGDDQAPYEGVAEVRQLDAAALAAARETHDFIVLDVDYAWCSKCRCAAGRVGRLCVCV